MIKPAFVLAAILAATSLSTASAQSRQASYQAYAVIDLPTDAPKATLIDAAERVLDRYTTDLSTNRPIAVQTPTQPGRFKLENPLAQHPMASLAALGGVSPQQFMVATCEGAVWTAQVQRAISGSQQLRATFCLFPYRNETAAGYHLNIYASDTAQTGGNVSERLGRALANRVVGTPRDFTERMLKETVAAMETSSGAVAVLLEGEPEIPGLVTSH